MDPDKLDIILLARIGAPGAKPPSAGEVARTVFTLVEAAVSPTDWPRLVDERIASLRARGLIEHDTLRLTDTGRGTIADVLGVDRPLPWRAVKSKLLVARALELDWSDPQTRRRLGDADGVRACLLQQRYELPIAEAPTLNQAIDALVWRHLGVETDERLTLARLKAHVLRQILGTDARLDDKKLAWLAAAQAAGTAVTHVDKLRAAVVGHWVTGPAEAAPQETTPTGEPPAGAGPDDRDPGELAGFARLVLEAARDVGAGGRFGDRKVFISAAWRALRARGGAGLDIEAFKRRLIDANRAGLVRLHRADLVGAMDPAEVRASEAAHLNATFHFIECEQGGMQ